MGYKHQGLITCSHPRPFSVSFPLPTHPRTFSRLLPLPSKSWGEFSGDAFCHKHLRVGERRGTVEVAPGCLAPRRGDCLVSSSSLLVWSTDLVPDCLTTAEVRRVSVHWSADAGGGGGLKNITISLPR